MFTYSVCMFECVHASTFMRRPKVNVRCLPLWFSSSFSSCVFFFFFTEPSAYQLGRLVGHQALGVRVSLTLHSGYRYAPPNTGSSCFMAGTLPTEPSPQPRFKYQIQEQTHYESGFLCPHLATSASSFWLPAD